MKKLRYLICTLFVFVLFFVGCSGSAEFVHDTKTYSKGGDELEFTVKEIENTTNTRHIIGSECLEFKIEVTAKTTVEDRGFEIFLYNFNFYFTEPQSIYEMEMYASENVNADPVQRILVKPNTTQIILLKVYFNNLYNEDIIVEDDNFVLELCGVRI